MGSWTFRESFDGVFPAERVPLSISSMAGLSENVAAVPLYLELYDHRKDSRRKQKISPKEFPNKAKELLNKLRASGIGEKGNEKISLFFFWLTDVLTGEERPNGRAYSG